RADRDDPMPGLEPVAVDSGHQCQVGRLDRGRADHNPPRPRLEVSLERPPAAWLAGRLDHHRNAQLTPRRHAFGRRPQQLHAAAADLEPSLDRPHTIGRAAEQGVELEQVADRFRVGQLLDRSQPQTRVAGEQADQAAADAATADQADGKRLHRAPDLAVSWWMPCRRVERSGRIDTRGLHYGKAAARTARQPPGMGAPSCGNRSPRIVAMALLAPFRALRPGAGVAARVSSVPYDVVSTAEARRAAESEPLS